MSSAARAGGDTPLIAPSLSLLQDSTLIDVRAPVEFAQGALPGAINLPLMDDDERRQVGTCFKVSGQGAAIALGQRLVDGRLREARIRAWRELACSHPDAVIYCARGGLRSQTAQQWLNGAGVALPRIKGGFKAMRQLLMAQIETAAGQPMLIVAGLTGCAKTALINRIAHGIDLEAHARHKGSSFGRRPGPLPSQIDFEHALGLDLAQTAAPYVFEDESHRIGDVEIPLPLWQTMLKAPRVRAEMPLDWRLEQIRKDYIEDLWEIYQAQYGLWLGWTLMRRQLSSALMRLRKRLGGERLARLVQLQQMAFEAHERGDSHAHEAWLAPLLTEYYDPMYHYQIEKNETPFVHVGDWDSCLAFVRQWCAEQVPR
ncbi:tRNA 2-selenouridine(34) synthase MnmH [Phytohalomonas tamaricis]|uniref:tRNA 2-selenouridine(34) synthase MnmH n=1 Tax=Phytohalomonas tamaricis TaxID=2081032 RepID=UPI0021D415FC|nr:tRNA 2-selenouridine(34) synthase MnmH [Phytohalomonas tamaricis]